jgi:hypothetical protein
MGSQQIKEKYSMSEKKNKSIKRSNKSRPIQLAPYHSNKLI